MARSWWIGMGALGFVAVIVIFAVLLARKAATSIGVPQPILQLTSTPSIPSTPTPGVRVVSSLGPKIKKFEPKATSAEIKIGQPVVFDVELELTGLRASRAYATCGEVTPFENPQIPTYSLGWDTSTCSPGPQRVTLLAAGPGDNQWTSPSELTRRVEIVESDDLSRPTVYLWILQGEYKLFHTRIQKGGCIRLSWMTSGGDRVVLDGREATPEGQQSFCPEVTKQFALQAWKGEVEVKAMVHVIVEA